MNKMFKDQPEVYDEKRLKKETDFQRFEWRLVNGVWINIIREFELKNGIYVLTKVENENKN